MKIETFTDLVNSILALADDVLIAEAALNKDNTPANRRSYIRTIFAMIEGVVYLLKQTIYIAGSKAKDILTIPELALLNDQSYDLNSKGEAYPQTKFLRLEDNFKFAFLLFSKIFKCEIDIDTGSLYWQNFLESIRIRNRISHPRSIEDFNVSPEELEIVRSTGNWFNGLWVAAIEALHKAFASLNKKNIIPPVA